MRALFSQQDAGPQAVIIKDVPEPALGPTDVRVRVHACGLNRADLLQVSGKYPPPRSVPREIPGLEYAGEILEVGARVLERKVGERVMGIVGGAAFAEQLVVNERELLAIPAALSFHQAAAIPEVFLTAFDALLSQAALTSGEWALIPAVASGVGTAALQIVQAVGATALGTARQEAKLERCRELGLLHGRKATSPAELEAAVSDVTQGRGVNVTLDLLGGDYLGAIARSSALKARIICVGMLGGGSMSLEHGTLMQKRLTVRGTTLRARPLEEKAAVARAFDAQMLPLFARGVLKPVVDRVIPFADFGKAFAAMAANETVGKIVLSW